MAFSGGGSGGGWGWGSETPEPCKGRVKPEESVMEAEKEVPVKRHRAM